MSNVRRERFRLKRGKPVDSGKGTKLLTKANLKKSEMDLQLMGNQIRLLGFILLLVTFIAQMGCCNPRRDIGPTDHHGGREERNGRAHSLITVLLHGNGNILIMLNTFQFNKSIIQ